MPNRGALRIGVLALLASALAARALIILYTVDVGDNPNALAVDTIDQTVYVSCEGSDSVYVLDATANTPEQAVKARVPVGDYPVDVVWNSSDNTMWVVNKETNAPSGSVTAIDAANNHVLDTIEVGDNPFKAVWTSVGNKLYTLQHETVTAVNCANRQVVSTIEIPDPDWGFSDMIYNPSMDRLYLVAQRLGQTGRLYVVDCATDQIVRSLGVANGPVKTGYAPSVNRAFVACDRKLNVIDCTADSVIGTLTIGNDPTSVMWSTTPVNRVWVGCGWGHAVYYMRADLLEIEGQVNTPGRNPGALLYNPHTTQVFAVSEQTHEVIVINARIPGIVDTLSLGPTSFGPYALALYRPMDRVFVANYWDRDPGTVTVLQDIVGIKETPARQLPSSSRAMPNPVGAGTRIVLQASGFKPTWATLVDVMGKTVHQGRLGGNCAVRAPEAPGVYFYTVTDGRQTSSGKFAVR